MIHVRLSTHPGQKSGRAREKREKYLFEKRAGCSPRVDERAICLGIVEEVRSIQRARNAALFIDGECLPGFCHFIFGIY